MTPYQLIINVRQPTTCRDVARFIRIPKFHSLCWFLCYLRSDEIYSGKIGMHIRNKTYIRYNTEQLRNMKLNLGQNKKVSNPCCHCGPKP